PSQHQVVVETTRGREVPPATPPTGGDKPPPPGASDIALQPSRKPLEAGELRRFEGHTAKVTAVAFLPDGRTAASAGHEKGVPVRHLQTGAMLRSVPTPGESNSLAVPADGLWLLVGGPASPQAQVWRVVDGRSGTAVGMAPGAVVSSVAFAPDNRALLGTMN